MKKDSLKIRVIEVVCYDDKPIIPIEPPKNCYGEYVFYSKDVWTYCCYIAFVAGIQGNVVTIDDQRRSSFISALRDCVDEKIISYDAIKDTIMYWRG